MFKTILSFAFSLCLPHFANAQLIEATDQPVIVKKTPDVVEEDSSEHHRIGKKYEISLTPVAVGPIPAANWGINVASYLTRNSAVLFGYSQLTVGFILGWRFSYSRYT